LDRYLLIALLFRVKVKGTGLSIHAMNAYGIRGIEVKLHSLLTSALVSG
jgi:hypothetical protein